MKKFASIAVFFACFVMSFSCEAEGDIESSEWRLVKASHIDAALLKRDVRSITLNFEGGRLSGFSGCNRIAGAYGFVENQLRISHLASTMMTCPVMELERAFHHDLDGDHAVEFHADSMRLTAQDGTFLLFERSVPLTLEANTWDVVAYNNGHQAVTTPLLGTRIHLKFENGLVHGFSGCNVFRSEYADKSGHLHISEPVTTRRACPDANASRQEKEFLSALQTATRWSVRSGTLDLHRADGERVLSALPLLDENQGK